MVSKYVQSLHFDNNNNDATTQKVQYFSFGMGETRFEGFLDVLFEIDFFNVAMEICICTLDSRFITNANPVSGCV